MSTAEIARHSTTAKKGCQSPPLVYRENITHVWQSLCPDAVQEELRSYSIRGAGKPALRIKL